MNYNPIITQKRIRELRKKNGLTQNDLAKRLHVSRPVITFYELGKQTPNIMDIFILAEELCTCPEYLLGLTDDPSVREEENRVLRFAVLKVRRLANRLGIQDAGEVDSDA